VRQEITFDGRPDLILHDSGGFEAGADDEFVAIQEFLKEKSTALDIKDRLHVIWFCIDINSPRTLQTATEKLFQAVSLYASDVQKPSYLPDDYELTLHALRYPSW
jgi:hypothetical protein